HQVSPVSGTTTYSYDPAANLTSTTDANSATTARVYDSLNRVLSVRSGDDVEARDIVARLLGNLLLIEVAKPSLARLYQEGDEAHKRCVVDGILEHLFEEPGVEQLFSEWRDDPELNCAFAEAQEWAAPLNRKRAFLTQ